jgi:hypothetical protein
LKQFRIYKIIMPQTSHKNKQSNDMTTPVFESPDGIRIRINRGGNKMQFIRDLCRNKEITDVQFRILVPLVDTSNEGTDDNCSRWGKSWLSLESLALESGCSKRAVEKNLPKLEAAGIVSVTREINDAGRSKGGRSNVNEYWLPGWNRFGVIRADEEKSERPSPLNEVNSERVARKQRTVYQATANAGRRNSERRSPDSTYLPDPEEHSQQTQSASSRRSGPVGSFDGDGQHQVANDNDKIHELQPVDDNQLCNWPDDWRDQFWDAFPERKNVKKAEAELISIAKAGLGFESLMIATRRYANTNPTYCRNPVEWLDDEPWRDNAKRRQRPRSIKRAAI